MSEIMILAGLYTLAFGFLMVTLLCEAWKKYYTLGKTINSLAFILVAIYAGNHGNHQEALLITLPAFVLCLGGDVLLGIFNQVKKKGFFLAGLLVFLAGHIAFIYSFSQLQPLSLGDFIFPVVGVLLCLWMVNLKNVDTGRLKVEVLIYSFFVSLFLSKAVHLAIELQNIRGLMLALGAFLFLASDIILLFLNFYQKRYLSLHVLNLITYYYGIFLIAASFLLC